MLPESVCFSNIATHCTNTAMLPPENAPHRVVLEENGGYLLSSYDVKTVMFVRNLTEKMETRKWTYTSYQRQCLQDIFASTQRGEINGTVLEWKFMVLQVNQLKVRKFLSFLNY